MNGWLDNTSEAGLVIEVFEADEVQEIPLVGMGFREPLAEWILSMPEKIDCLELTAEHFFDGGELILEQLRDLYPLSVHGLGLSLGTPGPIDQNTMSQTNSGQLPDK